MMKDIVLGIESSCDDTAIAAVDTAGKVLKSVVVSQEDIHGAYGGVYPEFASRAHVAAIVAGCTDSWTRPKPPWRQRKEAYLDKLPHKERDVLLVSCADKIDNARSILKDYRLVGESLWGRFRGGKEGTLWYYSELVKAFTAVETFPIGEELARVVAQVEALVAENQGR